MFLNYLTKRSNLSSCRGAMEVGNHSKNGVSLQNLSSRGGFIVLSLIASLFLLDSCMVASLTGRHAVLSEGSSYTSAEYKVSIPFTRRSPWEVYGSLGVGVANLDNTVIANYNLGAGLDYFFSRKRFQPSLGLDFNAIGRPDDKNKVKDLHDGDRYFNVMPNLGMRFYLSNRFSLNAGLGYQLGWGRLSETKTFYSGLAPSVGISFTVWKKFSRK
jgi:hypothetical protein